MIDEGLLSAISEDSIRKFTETLGIQYKNSSRDSRHMLVATLILTCKDKLRISYAEMAKMYGVLSSDSIKSLALRRIYVSDSHCESLHSWLVREIALYCVAEGVKDALRLLYVEPTTSRKECE